MCHWSICQWTQTGYYVTPRVSRGTILGWHKNTVLVSSHLANTPSRFTVSVYIVLNMITVGLTCIIHDYNSCVSLTTQPLLWEVNIISEFLFESITLWCRCHVCLLSGSRPLPAYLRLYNCSTFIWLSGCLTLGGKRVSTCFLLRNRQNNDRHITLWTIS